MKIALIVISIILIAIVLLQGGAKDDNASIISGGNSDLFANRKERGSELFITRLTAVLGAAFFIIALIMSL